jgi:sec-independent protein translocase protein TatB
MFDIGWSELLVIAIVALVVIGPKDLPQAFRVMGQWAAKARVLAREFQGHVDELMRETQVDEMKREFQAMARPPELEGLEADLMAGHAPQAPKAEPPASVPEASTPPPPPPTDEPIAQPPAP